jgi:hypothetical protein
MVVARTASRAAPPDMKSTASVYGLKLNWKQHLKADYRIFVSSAETGQCQDGFKQGLPLVHFSAHPEPMLSLEPPKPPYVSLKRSTHQAEKWTAPPHASLKMSSRQA